MRTSARAQLGAGVIVVGVVHEVVVGEHCVQRPGRRHTVSGAGGLDREQVDAQDDGGEDGCGGGDRSEG